MSMEWTQAPADFRFAAAVAEFGMILRDSPHKGNGTLAGVLQTRAGGERRTMPQATAPASLNWFAARRRSRLNCDRGGRLVSAVLQHLADAAIVLICSPANIRSLKNDETRRDKHMAKTDYSRYVAVAFVCAGADRHQHGAGEEEGCRGWRRRPSGPRAESSSRSRARLSRRSRSSPRRSRRSRRRRAYIATAAAFT